MSPSNPHIIPILEVFYFHHLTDEETEAWAGEVRWTRVPSIEVAMGPGCVSWQGVATFLYERPESQYSRWVSAAVTQPHVCRARAGMCTSKRTDRNTEI